MEQRRGLGSQPPSRTHRPAQDTLDPRFQGLPAPDSVCLAGRGICAAAVCGWGTWVGAGAAAARTITPCSLLALARWPQALGSDPFFPRRVRRFVGSRRGGLFLEVTGNPQRARTSPGGWDTGSGPEELQFWGKS